MIKYSPVAFVINAEPSMMCLVQLEDLGMVSAENLFEYGSCHIYMIGIRPRVTVIAEKFGWDGQLLDMTFKVWEQEQFVEFPCRVPNPFGEEKVTLKTSYPYNTFSLCTENNELHAKTAPFLSHFNGTCFQAEFLDLKVLYIGQSYGTGGARTAPDRLKNHSTFQAILSAAMKESPDKEVWIALGSFKQKGFNIAGLTDLPGISQADQLKRFNDFNDSNGITGQQFINFTEAALIRYFQPVYNEKYIHSFPNPAHSTYTECYDLDVHSVGVSMDTLGALKVRFYTDHAPKRDVHQVLFSLHNKSCRKDFFN